MGIAVGKTIKYRDTSYTGLLNYEYFNVLSMS
jgi:hypothetical protein